MRVGFAVKPYLLILQGHDELDPRMLKFELRWDDGRRADFDASRSFPPTKGKTSLGEESFMMIHEEDFDALVGR